MIGKYIKKLRKERGLSMRALETYSGVSHGYISHIERGLRHPSSKTLQKLAKPLRVEPEELLIQAGYIKRKNGIGATVEQLVALYPRMNDLLLKMLDLPRNIVEDILDYWEFKSSRPAEKKKDEKEPTQDQGVA